MHICKTALTTRRRASGPWATWAAAALLTASLAVGGCATSSASCPDFTGAWLDRSSGQASSNNRSLAGILLGAGFEGRSDRLIITTEPGALNISVVAGSPPVVLRQGADYACTPEGLQLSRVDTDEFGVEAIMTTRSTSSYTLFRTASNGIGATTRVKAQAKAMNLTFRAPERSLYGLEWQPAMSQR